MVRLEVADPDASFLEKLVSGLLEGRSTDVIKESGHAVPQTAVVSYVRAAPEEADPAPPTEDHGHHGTRPLWYLGLQRAHHRHGLITQLSTCRRC